MSQKEAPLFWTLEIFLAVLACQNNPSNFYHTSYKIGMLQTGSTSQDSFKYSENLRINWSNEWFHLSYLEKIDIDRQNVG